MMQVLEAGLLTTCQDRGRPGHAHQGIGSAGAFDRQALALANALVSNPPDACGLEITLAGPSLRFERDVWIALVGAPLPAAKVDDTALQMWQPQSVRSGGTVKLGGMPHGCRAWLAIDGGIEVPPSFGSRSSDVNSGLGPAPVRKGEMLPLGEAKPPPADTGWWLDGDAWFSEAGGAALRILRSRHSDNLVPASAQVLVSKPFEVTGDSNRVGVRLHGEALRLHDSSDVASSGLTAGTVQLPPDGQPIILACEHPVTGGYPRIGQVIEADLPRLAQLRPGDPVRFAWVGREDAHAAQALANRALQDTLKLIAIRRTGPMR